MKLELVEELHARIRASYGQPPWYHERGFSERLHAIAFWCLILFLAGALTGTAFAFRYHSNELSRATHLGYLIHNGVTYELKQR